MRRIVRMLVATSAVLTAAACQHRERDVRDAILLTHGDPDRGRVLIRRYGCAGCHSVPGVPGAVGLVGPNLAGIAERVYIAGRLTNTPDNLVKWIEAPRAVDPKTAMPNTGITTSGARDVAAYLYTLR